MEQFYNFIQELENNIKEYIENKNNKSIISQIRTHVKYDPILTLKLLQNRNKIKTEIKNNEGLLIYKDINKNSKIESEILVDSIWQYKENYVTKFKVIKVKKY